MLKHRSLVNRTFCAQLAAPSASQVIVIRHCDIAGVERDGSIQISLGTVLS
jgi:hypothetical protein